MEIVKPGIKIDFIGKMRLAVLISAALMFLSVVSLLYHKGPNWGVEFVGGTQVHVKFSDTIKPDTIRSILGEANLSPEAVQQLGLAKDNEYLIRFSAKSLSTEELEEFSNKSKGVFEEALGKGKIDLLGIDYIGPKVGRELIGKGIGAIILGWVGILIYLIIRFDLRFSLGAVIALIHDTTITMGAVSITDKEFTLTIVAALLTIIGYSVNDTIIIFDRIRENIGLIGKGRLSDIVNISVNQTLSRTILTSVTVFLVLLSLFFFGGAVIHDFAFALIVGVIVGTYSTVFVASAFVLYWEYKKRK